MFEWHSLSGIIVFIFKAGALATGFHYVMNKLKYLA
ncbi:Protein of unknown function [Bacillus wiedmannii]|nr:Protein of unknown function [Bacillus wiedmannii]